MNAIRTGARAPAFVQIDLAPEDVDGVDLSTVSAVVLLVRRPDQTLVTWSAMILDRAVDALTVVHELAADGSDVPIAGPYSVVARITVPGGALDSEPVAVPVRDSFDATTR